MGMVKVIASIDEDQKRRLYHVLLDEGITFSDWLRRQIDDYLKEKEKPIKSRKGEMGPME
jgi:hypothetical protein